VVGAGDRPRLPITDPFVALAIAAAVTESVEIGTAVVQVPLYHPVDLAHRVLSLMQACGDRFLFGVGAGSTQKDFDALGRDYTTRFRTFSERMIRTAADIRRRQTRRDRVVALARGTRGPTAAPRRMGRRRCGARREILLGLDRFGRVSLASGSDRGAATISGRRWSRAVVSTIQLGPATDLGATRAMLADFAAAGFDDAVVMLLPGGPSPAQVRALL
jgi:alkanesulfonate monooxygenase SsuD/methylene tetrahydromethanopterin reductase-like flavin-dependent oxidoreductase (luciferase family)